MLNNSPTSTDTIEAYKFIQQVIYEYGNKYSPEYTETDYGSSFNTDAFCKRMAALLHSEIQKARIDERVKATLELYDEKPKDRQLFNNIGNKHRDRIAQLTKEEKQ